MLVFSELEPPSETSCRRGLLGDEPGMPGSCMAWAGGYLGEVWRLFPTLLVPPSAVMVMVMLGLHRYRCQDPAVHAVHCWLEGVSRGCHWLSLVVAAMPPTSAIEDEARAHLSKLLEWRVCRRLGRPRRARPMTLT